MLREEKEDMRRSGSFDPPAPAAAPAPAPAITLPPLYVPTPAPAAGPLAPELAGLVSDSDPGLVYPQVANVLPKSTKRVKQTAKRSTGRGRGRGRKSAAALAAEAMAAADEDEEL